MLLRREAPVDAAAARHVGQPGDDVARHLRVDLLGELDERKVKPILRTRQDR